MHGGLSPALRPRQAGAPNVRGPSRPRREPTAITKDESRLQQKLLKNKIVPLLFKHTYALKPEKKKAIKSRTTQAHSKANRRFETRRTRHTSRRGRQKTRTQAQAESLTRRTRRGIRRFKDRFRPRDGRETTVVAVARMTAGGPGRARGTVAAFPGGPAETWSADDRPVGATFQRPPTQPRALDDAHTHTPRNCGVPRIRQSRKGTANPTCFFTQRALSASALRPLGLLNSDRSAAADGASRLRWASARSEPLSSAVGGDAPPKGGGDCHRARGRGLAGARGSILS